MSAKNSLNYFTSICSRFAINSCIVVTRATVLTLVSAKIDIECFPEVNLHCTILLIDNIWAFSHHTLHVEVSGIDWCSARFKLLSAVSSCEVCILNRVGGTQGGLVNTLAERTHLCGIWILMGDCQGLTFSRHYQIRRHRWLWDHLDSFLLNKRFKFTRRLHLGGAFVQG